MFLIFPPRDGTVPLILAFLCSAIKIARKKTYTTYLSNFPAVDINPVEEGDVASIKIGIRLNSRRHLTSLTTEKIKKFQCRTQHQSLSWPNESFRWTKDDLWKNAGPYLPSKQVPYLSAQQVM
jgi:hypothetical protein